MNEFITLPSYAVGSGVIVAYGKEIARLGSRAYIIGGEISLSVALDVIRKSLQDNGVAEAGLGLYGGECTYGAMNRLSDAARIAGADLIIGVGGGKCLDTAKGVGDMLSLPVITVPTIAATCAAVTSISVVYDDNRVFLESMFHKGPPALALVDLAVLSSSPCKYLRAGIGDGLAKYVEVSWAQRGRELSNASQMAGAVSGALYVQYLKYAREAMKDLAECRITNALEQVILSSVVTTGIVSILTDEKYNGGCAHALFYGLTRLPSFEKICLHGDAVGYGVLVQLMLDGQESEAVKIKALFADIGIPVRFSMMGFLPTDDNLDTVIPASIKNLYASRVIPYEVTVKMMRDAIVATEKLSSNGENDE